MADNESSREAQPEPSKDTLLRNMSDRDFELYIYSLRKMAENNLESNRTFMTELYNLRAFHYKTAELMLEHPQMKFAMIVLDFANFKSINEFCGRDVGDALLKCTADALREQKQMCDYVVLSHFRADIFGMFTPYETEDDLIAIVKQIDQRISEFKIPYKVLPAFGICVAESPTMSVSIMRDYATMALNTIKGKFYAKYAFFDEKMRSQMLLNKMIENDIVGALKGNQLHVYIQPKVDMTTGQIIGGEALVRWIHPERGLVTPGQFIPVLEKNGLIIDVDIYIWTKVFQFIGERLRKSQPIVPISINISRTHVFDKAFRECLIQLSEDFKVPPSYVVLELTESGFLENESTMYENLKILRQYGFTLSMDDFGTGYSSMTMLKNQPVDEIKIDRGFILDIKNPKSQSILSHTIAMLHELEMDIIVEGIETKAQEAFLLKCDCHRAQGFLYYKPIPLAEFEGLL